MRRTLAFDAEIVEVFYESRTKVVMPNSVDHHTRRKWMVRCGEPASKG